MLSRSPLLAAIVVSTLTLSACGGASDSESAQESGSLPADAPVDAVDETEVETDPVVETEPVSEPVADDPSPAAGDCTQVLAVEEIDEIFETSSKISGGGAFCRVVLRDDVIAGFNAFTGSDSDEAFEIQAEKFQQFATTDSSGVALADDRGFVFDGTAVVRGDSGTVYLFSVGEIDGIGSQTQLQAVADLLLVR